MIRTYSVFVAVMILFGAMTLTVTPHSCALGFSWTLDCERVLAGGVSR